MCWAVKMMKSILALPLTECPFVARTPIQYELLNNLNLYFYITYDNSIIPLITFLSYFQHSRLTLFFQYSKYLIKMNSLISLPQTELKLQPINDIAKIIPPLPILYSINKKDSFGDLYAE